MNSFLLSGYCTFNTLFAWMNDWPLINSHVLLDPSTGRIRFYSGSRRQNQSLPFLLQDHSLPIVSDSPLNDSLQCLDFSMVCHNPPMISVSFTHLSATERKDSCNNILATKGFTCNMISEVCSLTFSLPTQTRN